MTDRIDRVWYVYGVVPPSFELRSAPPGVDDAPVTLISGDAVAALASPVDADSYSERALDERSSDVAWLGPRAVAHDRVLTWASDAGPVVPFPIFSLFRTDAGVRHMLALRGAQLAAAVEEVAGAHEFTLRVFRLDDRLEGELATLSDEVASLERQVASATPGQRYLLGRKLAELRRRELARVGRRVAAEVFTRLAAVARDAVEDPIPAPTESAATAAIAVLNASFLVRHEADEEFRGELAALVARYEESGFRFEFTGPWPPYHFVRERADAR